MPNDGCAFCMCVVCSMNEVNTEQWAHFVALGDAAEDMFYRQKKNTYYV